MPLRGDGLHQGGGNGGGGATNQGKFLTSLANPDFDSFGISTGVGEMLTPNFSRTLGANDRREVEEIGSAAMHCYTPH